MASVTLHLCTTCRKRRGPDVATTRQLSTAAGKMGVHVELTSCLSGCQQGLCAMVETPDGMVRLRQFRRVDQVQLAISTHEQLIDGQAVPGLDVISRVNWSEWNHE